MCRSVAAVRTTAFDRATDVMDQSGGRYAAELSPDWGVGDKPNGGYLAAVVARAMSVAGGQPDPLSVTAHFLRPPAPGPVTIAVEPVRIGRVHSTLEAHMEQDGVERMRVLAVFGDLVKSEGPTAVTASPPELSPMQESVPARSRLPGGMHVAIVEQFDMLLDARTTGWSRGQPSGRAEVGAWVRFADGREFDLTSLLVVVDALPPAVFDLGLGGWVPTLELTTHLRAHPAPGWLRVWIRTRVVMGGYLEEDAEVWDSTDTLVAMSRQLALVPARPRSA